MTVFVLSSPPLLAVRTSALQEMQYVRTGIEEWCCGGSENRE